MTPEPTTPKRKILLVDDHPLVREWLTNLINQQADLVVCGEAATAPEAMQRIASTQPQLTVVDISLQASSGIELIKDFKRCFPNLLIIVFSMHDESLYAERALRAGARGYVMKREATRTVIEAIRCVLQGKFYMSDTIAQAIATQFVESKTLGIRSPIELLSDRELAVFDMLGRGQGTRQIAETLRVSIKTVQTHCARIKEKLNLSSASELVREAIRHQEAQVNKPQ